MLGQLSLYYGPIRFSVHSETIRLCNTFFLPLLTVIHQDFKVHVPLESYVIRGNDAIIKCEIPSFVGDLVKIFSWVDNSNKEYPADSPLFGKYMSVS